jgi:hypothetical protein
MANVTHNAIKSTKFHNGKNVNKREKRGSQVVTTMVESDTAFSLETEDGIDCIRNTGAVTITLPKVAENKGRCICFLQVDAAILTIAQNADGANIDGANADFTDCDAADDWVELYSTGSEWLIRSLNIA